MLRFNFRLSQIMRKKKAAPKKLSKKFMLKELGSALKITQQIAPALGAGENYGPYQIGGCSLQLATEFLAKSIKEIKQGEEET